VVAVTTARVLSPLLSSVLIIMLARFAGPEGLGRYTFLITLFQLLEIMKSCGLPTLMVRECSGKHLAIARAWHHELAMFGARGGLLLYGCLPLAAWTQADGGLMAGAILGLALFPSAISMSNDAFLLSVGRSPVSAWLALIEGLVRMALSLAVVWNNHGLVALCAVYGFCRFLHALVGWLLIRRTTLLDSQNMRPTAAAALKREAIPFGKVFVLPLALFRLDVLFLGFLSSPSMLGEYGAALRLFSVGLVLPDGALSAVFATISKLNSEGNEQGVQKILLRTIDHLGSALLITAISGTLLAPLIIQSLFGARFGGAAEVLCILVWGLPLFAWNRALGDSLVATGHQAAVGRIVILALLLGLAIYPPLIRSLGATGAAWALLCVCGLIVTLSSFSAVAHGLISPKVPISGLAPVVLGVLSAGLRPGAWRESILIITFGLAAWHYGGRRLFGARSLVALRAPAPERFPS
jgi:O-antigen/teichoic acid export membrane protein